MALVITVAFYDSKKKRIVYVIEGILYKDWDLFGWYVDVLDILIRITCYQELNLDKR